MKLLEFPSQRILVAVSGGIDSVVLLHRLAEASYRHSIELVVGHVDHQLRPESGDDLKFVGSLAQRLGLPFMSVNIKVRKSNSVQSQARAQRYAAMAQMAHRIGTKTIATGHHGNDRLENSMLRERIGRFGSLRSLHHHDDWDLQLWRPLLDTTRAQIEAFASERGLDWREDPSNAAGIYERNQIRLSNIPMEQWDTKECISSGSRRRTAHRWFIEASDVESLLCEATRIPGVHIKRHVAEKAIAQRSGRYHVRGGVLVCEESGFEIIRTTCQGDRLLPVKAREPGVDLNDLVELEF